MRHDRIVRGSGRLKWVLALTAASLVPAFGAMASLDDGLEMLGWHELVFAKKAPNHFSLDAGSAIDVSSDAGVSVLWRSIDETDTGRHLSWRWRVDQGPPPTDLAKKGGDDRDLAIYVSFRFDPDRAGLLERAKRALLQPFAEQELPGRVLMYAWGGTGIEPRWIDNPYLHGVGKIRLMQGPDSPKGVWVSETADLAADFAEAFREPMGVPYQIAISADSDDTKTTVKAAIANIQLAHLE